jgi:hypothetical protein
VYLTLVSSLALQIKPNPELDRALRRAWRVLTPDEQRDVRRILCIPEGRPKHREKRRDLN